VTGAGHGSDCHDDGALACQHDGTCDGAGGCRLYAKGVSCGQSICVGTLAVGRVCDGLGSCANSANGVDCSSSPSFSVCNGAVGGCANPCTGDDDCILGYYCAEGACAKRLQYGDKCTGATACPPGAFCADGVCCNSQCTGQCEACNTNEARGSCVGVVGAPAAGHAVCPSGAGGDVCRTATCDGLTRASCAGFVGASTMCRAASCADGIATAAAVCDQKGACQAAVTSQCTPYVCEGDVCATSCKSDADCATTFRCDATTGSCVSRSAASCDGMHTLKAPDGTTMDCAPYACIGTNCKTSCVSVLDCVFPAQCSPEGMCLAAASGASTPNGSGGGCGCVFAGDARSAGASAFALFGAVAAFVARRRRGARRKE
jgi:hypothetical protein